MFCFFKLKTAYDLRSSDWSSDVCSSDLMIDAARFGTQLDRLGDLVPITCYGIKLVHIRLDGSFTRVRRVTGGFDQLVDVLSFLLKKALGLHFVAIDEVIDQFGRWIIAAQSNLLHRVRHELHKRRRWQPVEGVLDGAGRKSVEEDKGGSVR